MILMPKALPKTLVLGAGGMPACMIATGALGAIELIGRPSEFRSIWVCSGSGAPAFLWAGSKSPRWVSDRVLSYDFNRMFPITESVWSVAKAIARSQISGEALQIGLRDTEPFGYRIAKHVGEFPLNIKTVATDGNSEIVFTSEGVTRLQDGKTTIISDTAAPVSIAVRATASVPVHMKPTFYNNMWLQDGALNRHGHCPTSLACLVDGCKEEDIIALVNDHHDTKERVMVNIGKHLAHNRQAELAQHAALMVNANVRSLRTLDFTMTHEKRITCILAGFHAMLRSLNTANYLDRVDVEKIIKKTQTLDGLYEWLDKREYNTESACA